VLRMASLGSISCHERESSFSASIACAAPVAVTGVESSHDVCAGRKLLGVGPCIGREAARQPPLPTAGASALVDGERCRRPSPCPRPRR
jgi:hypothetical protein